MWQRYGRALLTPLEGTLLLPWYLRAMGMRIGRRCVLGDGFAQVVDPDMITIEDGATVHAVDYKPNRAVFFPADLVHAAEAPSAEFPGLRVSLAYKLKLRE